MDWESKNFINLSEVGFDIEQCKIDFSSISVRCGDLARYRKAFRVKIRTLMKLSDTENLVKYMEKFYEFAIFVQYLYGYHSCAGDVELWQEEVAVSLQKMFKIKNSSCINEPELKYESINLYEAYFKKQFKRIHPKCNTKTLSFIQDEKSFLNLKDYAHFKKCYLFL